MQQEQTHHGKLIDQLRKDRLMSRPDLVEGIMSLRNYQRFASGAISIPNEKFHQLIDRLNMDITIFNAYATEQSNDELKKLTKARVLAMKFQIDEAKLVLATVNKDSLKSNHHEFLYQLAKLIIERSVYGKDTETFYDNLEKLINYPYILDYETINLAELNALILLSPRYYKKGDRSILDFLYKNLTQRTYISHTQDDYGINICYSTLAKGLYNLEDYDMCIEVCNEGIQMIMAKHFVTGFDNLLGYKALSLNKTLKRDEAIETALKLYMFLKSFGSNEHLRIYMQSLENNLNIKFNDYIELKRDL